MEASQIIRLPKKYKDLFASISDEDAGKIIKSVFGIESELEGMAKVYFGFISVDTSNMEKTAVNGKKGGRPRNKKTIGYENKKPQVIENDNLNERGRGSESERGRGEEVKEEDNNISTTFVVETAQPIEYGNKEINVMLEFLKKTAGVSDFKESQKIQRQYAKHLHSLLGKIGKEDFKERLKGILSDDFKAKNCNKIAYLYGEMKSYISNPLVPPEPKGVRTFVI